MAALGGGGGGGGERAKRKRMKEKIYLFVNVFSELQVYTMLYS